MPSPYESLSDRAFWRSAVALKHFSEIDSLWTPRFEIDPQHRIVSFGSCFAQHISRALLKRGFNWISTENPPAMSETEALKFNYNVYSCRTGNIYTTSSLLQWVDWAFNAAPDPSEVWRDGCRFFDPFRPTIEPGGFESADELLALRQVTIRAFAEAVCSADFFVFTLGLTERWLNRRHGYEYQMCPGTAAGAFDAGEHAFENLDILQVIENLRKVIDVMRVHNSRLRILLTVSPVPLTATNTNQHVLVAALEAKSILRAAASQMTRYRDFVDYFPSYEIISSPAMGGVFFAPNKRTVTAAGVDFVMQHFFSRFTVAAPLPTNEAVAAPLSHNIVCEEELLEAFAAA